MQIQISNNEQFYSQLHKPEILFFFWAREIIGATTRKKSYKQKRTWKEDEKENHFSNMEFTFKQSCKVVDAVQKLSSSEADTIVPPQLTIQPTNEISSRIDN